MGKKNSLTFLWLSLGFVCWLATAGGAGLPLGHAADPITTLKRLTGPKDAVMVTDPQGKVLAAENTNTYLVPASTLKILTALVALHHLGPQYRFVTEVYTAGQSNLKIKGYGDPYLVSEYVAQVADAICTRTTRINDIVLDDTYFHHSITIPGVQRSLQPYDATNGALCINFNTVEFKRDANGNYVSAEAQTPLLPMARKRARQSGLNAGRIVFSPAHRKNTLYSGHMLRYFIEHAGTPVTGGIRLGTVDSRQDILLYRYHSPMTLEAVIVQLLEYSNNFIANQILLALGADVYGPPATLEKGIRAVGQYTRNHKGIEGIQLAEGSGISRKNRVTAAQIIHLLELFEPHHGLMRHTDDEFYKTGTLNGIRARAGYLQAKGGRLYRFAVVLNTPGKVTSEAMASIRSLVKADGG